MEEEIRIKPKLEVHVRAHAVMEETLTSKQETIGRFKVECGPLVDGKAVCKLTPVKEG